MVWLGPWLACCLLLLPVRSFSAEVPAGGEAELDAAVLCAAYPEAVLGLEYTPDQKPVLVLANGQRLVYATARDKTAEAALENPDVKDMLEQVYPLGEAGLSPAPGFDPGRRRVTSFFKALYGQDKEAVQAGGVAVPFLGRRLLFHGAHGAAAALNRVGERLAPLVRAHRAWRPTLFPMAGTFCWRPIAGTTRLSLHSFAVAVDFNGNLPYWRTFRGGARIAAERRAFPAEVVAAFEAEGFIWGGKWASFDLMHFEYRPEMLLKARVLAGQVSLP